MHVFAVHNGHSLISSVTVHLDEATARVDSARVVVHVGFQHVAIATELGTQDGVTGEEKIFGGCTSKAAKYKEVFHRKTYRKMFGLQ